MSRRYFCSELRDVKNLLQKKVEHFATLIETTTNCDVEEANKIFETLNILQAEIEEVINMNANLVKVSTYQYTEREDLFKKILKKSNAESTPYTLGKIANNRCFGKVDDGYDLYNEKGEKINTTPYAEVLPFVGGIAAVREHLAKEWNIIDPKGKKIYIGQILYDELEIEAESIKIDVITKDGYVVIEVSTGLSPTGKMILNARGKPVFSDIFQKATYEGEGLFRVQAYASTRMNLLRSDGSFVFQNGVDNITTSHDGLMGVNDSGKRYFINNKGKAFYKNPEFIITTKFSNSWAVIKKEDKEYFLHTSGKLVEIPEKHITVSITPAGVVCHKAHGSMYLYTHDGRELDFSEFGDLPQQILECGENMTKIKLKEGTYLIVNTKGEPITSEEFIKIREFNNGMLAVCKKIYNKEQGNTSVAWNYLQKNGEFLLNEWCTEVSDFEEGVGLISYTTKEGKEYANVPINVFGEKIFQQK